MCMHITTDKCNVMHDHIANVVCVNIQNIVHVTIITTVIAEIKTDTFGHIITLKLVVTISSYRCT